MTKATKRTPKSWIPGATCPPSFSRTSTHPLPPPDEQFPTEAEELEEALKGFGVKAYSRVAQYLSQKDLTDARWLDQGLSDMNVDVNIKKPFIKYWLNKKGKALPDDVEQSLQPHNKLAAYRRCLAELSAEEIEKVAALLSHTAGVLTAGNGGSASTASHFAADLRRVGVPATCLCDSIAVVTGLANDHGYERVFADQILPSASGLSPSALHASSLVLVLISASGESPSILVAAKHARERGVTTVALTGFGGGTLSHMVDYSIILSSRDYGEVEGVHSCLCHIIPSLIHEIKLMDALKQSLSELKSDAWKRN